jgi:NADH dehydrogenase (ubiquinone) 1 alpha/beta subcomplex 1
MNMPKFPVHLFFYVSQAMSFLARAGFALRQVASSGVRSQLLRAYSAGTCEQNLTETSVLIIYSICSFYFLGAHQLTEPEVKERVLNVVKNFQGVDPVKVTDSVSFQKDLGLDSLSVVEVCAFSSKIPVVIVSHHSFDRLFWQWRRSSVSKFLTKMPIVC